VASFAHTGVEKYPRRGRPSRAPPFLGNVRCGADQDVPVYAGGAALCLHWSDGPVALSPRTRSPPVITVRGGGRASDRLPQQLLRGGRRRARLALQAPKRGIASAGAAWLPTARPHRPHPPSAVAPARLPTARARPARSAAAPTASVGYRGRVAYASSRCLFALPSPHSIFASPSFSFFFFFASPLVPPRRPPPRRPCRRLGRLPQVRSPRRRRRMIGVGPCGGPNPPPPRGRCRRPL